MSSAGDSDNEQGDDPMVGFLFGNIDKNLQLDADYMDEVSRGAGRYPEWFNCGDCLTARTQAYCCWLSSGKACP